MTTKDLIDWSLKLAELCRSDHPRPDLADMHEAIAARLKALEEVLRWYATRCADVNRRGDIGETARNAIASDAGKRARAILDAAREVGK